MPAKNSTKVYVENGYYHIYNRGVEKRTIFMDHQDYVIFLSFLKRYLTHPPEKPNEGRPRFARFRTDIFERIQLIAYCLMSNHFHLMIKQSSKEAIIDFMQALINSYVSYFNKRYERTGPLFQGRYKAVLVDTEPYLLHLTRYIHLNPYELGFTGSDLVEHSYSSYKDFLGERHTSWVHPEEILKFFKTAQKIHLKDILSYQSFVEDYKEDSKELLGSLALD